MGRLNSSRMLLGAVAFAFCITACLATITQSNLDIDDRKHVLLTDAFGFGHNGTISITIKGIKTYPKFNSKEDTTAEVAWDTFGFFLSPVEADASLEQDLADYSKCMLDGPVVKLFDFTNSSIQKLITDEEKEVRLEFSVDAPGLFFLYFANCAEDVPISFSTNIEMFNTDVVGKKDYLSIGETELVEVYGAMCVVFTAMAAAWAYYVYRHRDESHKIHYLMFGLVVFKALTLLSQALTLHYIELTGEADGWNIAYYIFTFFRGVLFFTVIVLVGTGWSYMKPFLGDKEKKILLVVVPLQVFANIAIVITDEESPSVQDWFTWREVFHLVDIVCCCAILFPIVWSIKHLREASQTDGKAARNLEKLTLFRQFYVMVVVYIYFTRIVVYLLNSTMPYEYKWISTVANEFATLVFYVWTGVRFRPHNENPYLKLEKEDVDV